MKAPEDLQLIHTGTEWIMSFGKYRAVFPACDCALFVCTCKRRPPARSYPAHHRTHCHAGHAEHMAVKIRTIARGLKR